jgi:hypothetical protein
MAKRKSKSPVVIDKKKFLLPKLEFFELDAETGEGFYVRELGGHTLLEHNEAVERMQREAGADAELSDAQGLELMARFVMNAICYEDGKPFFTMDDVDLLQDKNPGLLKRIAERAMAVSGINPDIISGVTSSLKNEPSPASVTD